MFGNEGILDNKILKETFTKFPFHREKLNLIFYIWVRIIEDIKQNRYVKD